MGIAKLVRLSSERDLYIALSLNPTPDVLPEFLGKGIEKIEKFNKIAVEAVSEVAGAVCLDCYRYNIYGDYGIYVFASTLNFIMEKGLFAISENTAFFKCDGATVSPYGRMMPDGYAEISNSSGMVYFMHINSFDQDIENKMTKILEETIYCTWTGDGFCNMGISIIPQNAENVEILRDAFDDCFFIVEPPTEELYSEAVRCCFRRDGQGALIKTDKRFFRNCGKAKNEEELGKIIKNEFIKWNRRAKNVLTRKAFPVCL
jgi:hypothetical protein